MKNTKGGLKQSAPISMMFYSKAKVERKKEREGLIVGLQSSSQHSSINCTQDQTAKKQIEAQLSMIHKCMNYMKQ